MNTLFKYFYLAAFVFSVVSVVWYHYQGQHLDAIINLLWAILLVMLKDKE